MPFTCMGSIQTFNLATICHGNADGVETAVSEIILLQVGVGSERHNQ